MSGYVHISSVYFMKCHEIINNELLGTEGKMQQIFIHNKCDMNEVIEDESLHFDGMMKRSIHIFK